MSYPKYYATYCVMDGEAGSNPFWHASLLLSKQESEDAAVMVVDAIGFYSQASTTTNPIIGGLKHLLGFKIDLQDGHGVLKQEKMRDIDGNGLHGISFEATFEQFKALNDLYTKKMALEKTAIDELDEYLHTQGRAANGYTRHIAEKALAARKKEDPRLQPFHITMSLTLRGFDSSASRGCKTTALDLLLKTGIIDEAMRDKISGSPAKRAFPRFGDVSLMPLRLVSTGDPEKDVSKRTGKIHYNREWGERNKLFWATQPYVPTPAQTNLSAAKNKHLLIKDILTRVRKTEIILRNKINELEGLTPPNLERKHQLEIQLKRVQDLYKEFSVSYINQIDDCLKESISLAECVLNSATMSLTPYKMNYTFMLRAFESIAIRNAMLGLLGLVVASVFLSNPVGAVLMTTAALFTGHQLYGFFKEENKYIEMRRDYRTFLQESRVSKETDRGQLEIEHSAAAVSPN